MQSHQKWACLKEQAQNGLTSFLFFVKYFEISVLLGISKCYADVGTALFVKFKYYFKAAKSGLVTEVSVLSHGRRLFLCPASASQCAKF